jgi:HD-GYP domain-containing protein (c-di-GMP phosphodiesterase class II)
METIHINPDLLRTLLVTASIVEARDPYTGGHMWRVGQYARRMGERFGFSEGELFVLSLAGLVHDIGKMGVPEAILKKKGSLDQNEYQLMRGHPVLGKELVDAHPIGRLVSKAILQHHERFDGQGYPIGLSGAQIDPYAQVIAVADSFDAMTSRRPYQLEVAVDQARNELWKENQHQFSPAWIRIFQDLLQEGKFSHIIGHSGEDRLMVECPDCGPILAIPATLHTGDDMPCPGCSKLYILHQSGETFELEWDGNYDYSHLPHPDTHMIDEFLKQAPKNLRL